MSTINYFFFTTTARINASTITYKTYSRAQIKLKQPNALLQRSKFGRATPVLT